MSFIGNVSCTNLSTTNCCITNSSIVNCCINTASFQNIYYGTKTLDTWVSDKGYALSSALTSYAPKDTPTFTGTVTMSDATID